MSQNVCCSSVFCNISTIFPHLRFFFFFSNDSKWWTGSLLGQAVRLWEHGGSNSWGWGTLLEPAKAKLKISPQMSIIYLLFPFLSSSAANRSTTDTRVFFIFPALSHLESRFLPHRCRMLIVVSSQVRSFATSAWFRTPDVIWFYQVGSESLFYVVLDWRDFSTSRSQHSNDDLNSYGFLRLPMHRVLMSSVSNGAMMEKEKKWLAAIAITAKTDKVRHLSFFFLLDLMAYRRLSARRSPEKHHFLNLERIRHLVAFDPDEMSKDGSVICNLIRPKKNIWI